MARTEKDLREERIQQIVRQAIREALEARDDLTESAAGEEQLKRQICQVGRQMHAYGFVVGREGNVSARLGDGRFLCTPTEISKGSMTPQDIAVVDEQGNQLTGRLARTSEVGLHLLIYRLAPAVNAVVHAHPPHATAYAAAGVAPPAGVLPEVEMTLGPIPVAQYETPGTRALAETIQPHLRAGASAILLANHGAVACGADLLHAWWRMETLERYCQILLLSRQLGGPRPLPENKLAELLGAKKRLGLSDLRT